jgi:MoaA/NifB/PqqE/SkfB family radical SAM enzyme
MNNVDKQIIFGQNKILNHPEKVLEWIRNGENTLITVEIDLTNRCNNKCPKCTGWSGKKEMDELTADSAYRYIREVKDLNARAIIFTGGGEPLLHPNFKEILVFAKDLGLKIGVITNGLALSQDNMSSILLNCDWVRVSLDAGNKDMYKRTHGMDGNSWNTVLKNTRELVSTKRYLNSNCVIGTAYLTGIETSEYGEMEDFVEVSSDLEVDYAQFRPFHGDFTDVREKLKILREQYGEIVTASWQKYNRFGDSDKRPYKKCYGINFATTVCANGDMFICCHMRGIDKYKLGSLKTEKMSDIWKKRQGLFDKIDFKECPMFCRCDEFNRLLDEIKKPNQHPEFL